MANKVVYVNADYQQQEDDIVLHSFGESAKISVVDETLYTKWVITDEDKLAMFAVIEEEYLDSLIQATIYDHYPERKQAQDEKWTSSFTVKLKAAGVQNLEAQLVSAVGRVAAGEVFDTVVSSVVATLSPKVLANIQGSSEVEQQTYANYMFGKLVKIALRTEWAENCIAAAVTAAAANKRIDFPEYPEL